MPESNQALVIGEDGLVVIDLALGVDRRVVRVQTEPRRARGEAGVGRGVPLHRCPGVIPRHVREVLEHGGRIDEVVLIDVLTVGVETF